MAKIKYHIEYKYEGDAWRVYDKTMVKAWADQQENRCKSDHRGAEVRIRKV
jgi:hypothetical protein